MVEKENKFFIVNWKYLNILSIEGKNHLNAVIDELGKIPQVRKNKYIACNQDEPYAERIWQIILEHEREKQTFKNLKEIEKGWEKNTKTSEEV